MTHIGYLIAGWGISLTAIGTYTWSVVSRGKTLSGQVDADRRRWIQSNTANQPNPTSTSGESA